MTLPQWLEYFMYGFTTQSLFELSGMMLAYLYSLKNSGSE